MGEDITLDKVRDLRRQSLAEYCQLGSNLSRDGLHPPGKIGDFKDPEITRGKKTRSHDGLFRKTCPVVIALYGILARSAIGPSYSKRKRPVSGPRQTFIVYFIIQL
jgi:hypothetical protein